MSLKREQKQVILRCSKKSFEKLLEVKRFSVKFRITFENYFIGTSLGYDLFLKVWIEIWVKVKPQKFLEFCARKNDKFS